MTESLACPLCGSRSALWILADGGRQLWRCPDCGFAWVPQGVARTAAGVSIYEDETPVFVQDGNEDYYLDDINLRNAEMKLGWVDRHAARGARLLDVGANYGHFLAAARQRYETAGLEPSAVAARWAAEHFDLEIRVGSIYDPPSDLDGRYDVVTLWDVIEHLPEPLDALRQAHQLLAPGGLLFLSTPDLGSLMARLLGRRWYYIDPLQHIALFNRANLTRLLAAAGFAPQGARTFGHVYRVSYVTQRLRYLYSRGLLALPVRLATALLRPFSNAHVTINLGDVMGLVARRPD